MPHDIFISYSRRDLAAVKPIKEELEEQGFSCWMDLGSKTSQSEEALIRTVLTVGKPRDSKWGSAAAMTPTTPPFGISEEWSYLRNYSRELCKILKTPSASVIITF